MSPRRMPRPRRRPFFHHEVRIERPAQRELRSGGTTDDDTVPPVMAETHTDLNVQELVPEQELTAAGDIDTERLSVHTPPGKYIDVQAGDRAIYRGNTYRVEPRVVEHFDPRNGAPHHQEFTITRTIRGPRRG